MATVLDRKYTKKDSVEDIAAAILTLAKDKNLRILIADRCEWLEMKLKEIARLATILKSKL